MTKILTPVVAAFAVMAATLAYAAEATDTIKAIDKANDSVTLNDGKIYAFYKTTDLSKVKVGDKVKITFLPGECYTGCKYTGTAIAPAG